MQQCQSNAYENKLVQNLIDRTSYATLYNAGIRLTEWGFSRYIYDSLITQIAHPDMIDQLWLCNADTLLYAIGQYNIRLLIEAIAAYSPAGTNYLNATWATFSSTYPNPAGLARNQYLAQVVPKNVLLAHIKANYSNWVSNLGDQLTQADMVRMISQYYPRCDFETCIWNKVDDGTLAFDSSQLIQYTKNHYWSYLMERLYENNADTFTLQAAYTRPKIIVDLFERWHLPLSTFMSEVETHFDLATRNAIDVDTIKKVQYLWVNEWNMYGSSRLGTYQAQSDTVRGVIRSYNHRVSNDTVAQAYFSIDTLRYNKFLVDSIHHLHKGRKRYEGTNHLGNVLVVYTDKRLTVCTNDTIHYYRADVVNAYEYSPFGAIMPDRKWDSDTTLKYRFGFNGQEKDNEVSGEGNYYSFEHRVHDVRLGRFLSLDPLIAKFSYWSPYLFAANNPVAFIDNKGKGPEDPSSILLLFFEVTLTLATEREAKLQIENLKKEMNGNYEDIEGFFKPLGGTHVLSESGLSSLNNSINVDITATLFHNKVKGRLIFQKKKTVALTRVEQVEFNEGREGKGVSGGSGTGGSNGVGFEIRLFNRTNDVITFLIFEKPVFEKIKKEYVDRVSFYFVTLMEKESQKVKDYYMLTIQNKEVKALYNEAMKKEDDKEDPVHKQYKDKLAKYEKDKKAFYEKYKKKEK